MPIERTNKKRTQPDKARRREIAIAALLMASGRAEAAKRARVSVSTLEMWLRDPAFIAEYHTAARNVMETVRARLRAEAVHAIRILQQIEDDLEAPHQARVSAASALLKYGLCSLRGAEARVGK
ncbi:MAG: hypothetical protein WCE63_23285 [Acidobacteriaceae bacterium]